MPVIRYGKTGLLNPPAGGGLGQATPTYTPPYSPTTYTPTQPTYTPSQTYTPTQPTYTPSQTYTPGYLPQYTPYPFSPYQGTPSYAPPPEGTPIKVNPEEAGLEPEGAGPAQLIYGGGGAYGPAIEELPAEEVPVEEAPKKTNWLLWLALAAGAYILLGGDIL